jgi:hypothetical protein
VRTDQGFSIGVALFQPDLFAGNGNKCSLMPMAALLFESKGWSVEQKEDTAR